MEPKRQAGFLTEEFSPLAGGAAHDLSNIISGILLQLGQMQRNWPGAADYGNRLGPLEREVVRAANLTRQLVLFTGRQPARMEPVNLKALARNLLKTLRMTLAENVDLGFEESSHPSWIKGDLGYLEQMVVNLCVAAQNAMPNGGRMDLRLTQRALDLQGDIDRAGVTSRGFISMELSIDPDDLDDTILENLAKDLANRKGLRGGIRWNFAAVCTVAELHDGWVEVGTRRTREGVFRVYLPTVIAPSPDDVERSEVIVGGSETILLVEDLPSLRRDAALCLRKLGYAVFEAADAAEARRIWAESRETIDLLFADMTMAESTTGLDLALDCLRSRKSLKVIITSGALANSKLLRLMTDCGVSFLSKPYQYSALARGIRDCLSQPRIN